MVAVQLVGKFQYAVVGVGLCCADEACWGRATATSAQVATTATVAT